MAKPAQNKKPEFLDASQRTFTLSDFDLPNLGQMTPSAIVDELGVIKAVKKQVDALEKFLVTACKARTQGNLIIGEHYQGMVSMSERTAISAELARQVLDEETLAKITSTSPVETLKVSKK